MIGIQSISDIHKLRDIWQNVKHSILNMKYFDIQHVADRNMTSLDIEY